MKDIAILGCGMAGLLAANMLNKHNVTVFEKQPTLPHNHSAVLRFKTSVVGDVLGIPFKAVNMAKAVIPWRNPIADLLSYSYKNLGMTRSDRSIKETETYETRYIAPPDLIPRMFEQCHRSDFKFNFNITDVIVGQAAISTIPMPILMAILDYPDVPQFRYIHGVNLVGRLADCEAYVSALVPDPQYPFTRVSITGDELIIELPLNRSEMQSPTGQGEIVDQACYLLGINRGQIRSIKAERQSYFKIAPIPDDVRKNFMLWATTRHNIYSLGRYATWRPRLMLDDLVKDIRLIERWITQGSHYEAALRQ